MMKNMPAWVAATPMALAIACAEDNVYFPPFDPSATDAQVGSGADSASAAEPPADAAAQLDAASQDAADGGDTGTKECSGKADGIYCSTMPDQPGTWILCKGGHRLQSNQCADNKRCVESGTSGITCVKP